MNSQQETRQMGKIIQGFIEINQDMLNIPDLSNEQRDHLLNLGNELKNLEYQGDETKIKNRLLDVFNRLN
jgi:hypothetical protein